MISMLRSGKYHLFLAITTIGFILELLFEPRLVITDWEKAGAAMGMVTLMWTLCGVASCDGRENPARFEKGHWALCFAVGLISSNVAFTAMAQSMRFPDQGLLVTLTLVAISISGMMAARLYPVAYFAWIHRRRRNQR